MDTGAFLSALGAEAGDSGSLAHVRTFPARDRMAEPFPGLPQLVRDRLGLAGIEGLFPHQRRAVDLLGENRDVIVATGTASGKTLVYNLAFARAAAEDPKATALYLFPTKALARDQLRQVRDLRMPMLKAAVYDGDTPRAERPLIRKNANLVMSNPDMLHRSILPDHARWADFFLRLSLVVLDEAHTARGVFGSHVAMILRRLRRIVAHYGGEPRFAMASATIGNPGELAERLTGLPFDAVTEDLSPSGERQFVLWNPPVTDEVSGARRSALTDSSRIVGDLVESGARTIAFARSRKAAELLAEFARRDLPGGLRGRIKAYRAGYLPEERRDLERALAEGELLAICATTALELGVDVGSLDAAVLAGYPGTRASMWQQAGRAGRTGRGSVAILVAQDDPLDQYLVNHPDELFDLPPEAAVIDPTNAFVLRPHIACAAREMPLRDEELSFFGEREAVGDAVAGLIEAGALTERRRTLHHRGTESPHRAIDIRSASGATVRIAIGGTGELIGTIDEARAHSQVHPGAIYLHQGEQFEVGELDLEGKVALVSRKDADFYTQSRDTTDIHIREELSGSSVGDVPMRYGVVHVTNQVVGFVRKSHASGEILGTEQLALPKQTLETTAVWWAIPPALLQKAGLRAPRVPGGAHAAEHAAIGLLPLVATCDRWDVGGVSTALHPDTGTCAIFVYDGYPGGAGIAERGFRAAERWLDATLTRVRECRCAEGCPSCVQSPKCGNGNEPLDKAGAVALLAALLKDSGE